MWRKITTTIARNGHFDCNAYSYSSIESMPIFTQRTWKRTRQNFRDKRIITRKSKKLRLAMSGTAEQ